MEFTKTQVAAANSLIRKIEEEGRNYNGISDGIVPRSYSDSKLSAWTLDATLDAPYGNGLGIVAQANIASILHWIEEDTPAHPAALDRAAVDAGSLPILHDRGLHHECIEFAPAILVLAAESAADPEEWQALAEALDNPEVARNAGVDIEFTETGHATFQDWMQSVAALAQIVRDNPEAEGPGTAAEYFDDVIQAAREFASIVQALADYPVLDDERLLSMELEAEEEYWTDYGALELAEALAKISPGAAGDLLAEELGEWSCTELARIEELRGWLHTHCQQPFIQESSGLYFDCKRSAEAIAEADPLAAEALARILQKSRGLAS